MHAHRIWSSLNLQRDENVTSVVDHKVSERNLIYVYLNHTSVTITHLHEIIYKLLIIVMLQWLSRNCTFCANARHIQFSSISYFDYDVNYSITSILVY